jgi:hypothetical protein
MAYYLYQHNHSAPSNPAIPDTADPNGRKGQDQQNQQNKRKHCYTDEDVKAAKEEYPNKANLPDEAHHIEPQFLGGDPKGATVSLPSAYHQLITNAFRDQWPYGAGDIPLEHELQDIMNEVYNIYPFQKCN